MKAAGHAAPQGAGGGPGDLAAVAASEVDGDLAVSAPDDGNGNAAPMGAHFDAMDRKACIAHWIDRFGHAPPRYSSVRLMRKALAHEAQVEAHGDHAPAVRKRLRDVLGGGRKRGNEAGRAKPIDSKPPVAALLRPGTHLVREWNGRTHTVEVVDDGFRMDGRHYRSLSAIARKITGAHWSGPRFFGVAKR